MDQAAFEKLVLDLSIVLTAAGGMLVVAFAIDGARRYAASALIGIVAAILMTPKAAALDHQLGLVAIGLLAGLTVAVAGRISGEMSDGLRALLRPSRWKGAPTLAPRDLARRWFVTTAAATGSVVIALFTFPEFWSALAETFSLLRLVGAAALTVVSIVLIGPFQDYVLGRGGASAGEEAEMPSAIAGLLEQGATWRGWIRFAVVWLMLVATDLLFNNISEAVKAEEPRIISAIIVTGLAPAVVSYYWSAALQLGERGIGRATVWPSTAGGAVLYVGSATLIAMSVYLAYFYPPSSDSSRDTILVVPVALLLAAVIGFGTCGIHAAVGGHVLDRFDGVRALAALAVAMAAVGVLQVAVLTGITRMMGHAVNPWSYGTMIGGIAGWYLGLLASGFPQLVMRKPAASSGP